MKIRKAIEKEIKKARLEDEEIVKRVSSVIERAVVDIGSLDVKVELARNLTKLFVYGVFCGRYEQQAKAVKETLKEMGLEGTD